MDIKIEVSNYVVTMCVVSFNTHQFVPISSKIKEEMCWDELEEDDDVTTLYYYNKNTTKKVVDYFLTI